MGLFERNSLSKQIVCLVRTLTEEKRGGEGTTGMMILVRSPPGVARPGSLREHAGDHNRLESGMREPTMADIADHLGVSRQLVSIVLRDMPGASQETRDRVTAAARELGYSPHIGARTLRQTKSLNIGVVFAPAHATEPDIVEAIYPAAAALGYRVVLSAQTRTRSTTLAVEELLGYRCAAIIVIGSLVTAAQMRALAKRVKVPLVVVGAGERSTIFDVVRSAGDRGIDMVVQHLIELGHRRIAYLHAESMPPASLRLRGYLGAMKGAGLAANVVDIPGADFTEESGAVAGRELLARDEPPTAVVTGNDQQAIGLLQVLSRAGVRVPERVSLTGYDDSRFARLSSVDLTSVRQDPEAMGRAAIAAAVRRIDDPTLRPSLSVVEPTLVVRGSTGRPR
jgi:DNA-binding LacI/PurR family transcriptional regulator